MTSELCSGICTRRRNNYIGVVIITTPEIKGKNSDCSIYIEEIKHGEMILILPVCCRKFHYACIRL